MMIKLMVNINYNNFNDEQKDGAIMTDGFDY